MSISCRRKRRDRPLLPGIAVLVVASLALLVRGGQGFGNMLARGRSSAAALSRASAAAVRRVTAITATPRHLDRHGSTLSMAWGDDSVASGRGRQVDRGFSNGGVEDKRYLGGGSGGDGATRYPSTGGTERDRGGSTRGRRRDTDGGSGGGGGGEKHQRFTGGRPVEGDGNYYRGGGSRAGGGGARFEDWGRGRGRGWEEVVDKGGDKFGGGRGGRARGGGYDRDFRGRADGRGRGGGSSWSDGRGRRGGREGRGNGGRSSYAGARSSARGRGGGRSFRGMDDGPSRAWTPEAGGEGAAWGAGRRERGGAGGGGSQRYGGGDDDGFVGEGQEGEEGFEEIREEWVAARPSPAPASDWMRGELSGYQAELSSDADEDEDTNFDMVYGIAPVLNALRNDRRQKLGLYCQDGLAPANKKDRAAANQIYDLAREADVPMTTTDKGYLNTLCGNRPHQGFILKARPLEFEPILFLPRVEGDDTSIEVGAAAAPSPAATSTNDDDDVGDNAGEGETERIAPTKRSTPAVVAAATGQVWLALDEVTDPQNFGALLRSAHFFGASGVVTCAKNSASLTATVSKSSAGAVEVMRVHSTANMMRFLKRSRENGWRVVGTSVSERSGPLHELPAGPGAPPTIVVLGNEGYGVRTNVLRECEFLVEVAGNGGGALAEGATASTVDSLNVSVTGGVVLFHLLARAKHSAAAAATPPVAAAT